MEGYLYWVKANPLLAAFIQFAVLGTLGEAAGMLASGKRDSSRWLEWPLKALAWGCLGALVKYAFVGFAGFLAALVERGFLPAACAEAFILRAFCLSVLMNAQFGPLLMFLHRSSDNLITGAKGYAGIEKSLLTLAWFWVPAHTITFSLPQDYQIGVAALLSLALGLIMGFTKRDTAPRRG